MLIRFILVLLCVLIISHSAITQNLRFGSGVIAGINLAQVDGDDMQGYDKSGLNFGLRGIAFILPKLEIQTELTYSQQGSQSKSFKQEIHNGRKLYVDYGGVTGLIAINDWYHPIKEFYRFQLIGGVSLKRLIRSDYYDGIRSDTRKVNFKDVSPYFSTTDFSMILGANFKLTPKAGLSFRYNRSFNYLLDSEAVQQYFERKQIISMKQYFLSADVFYQF
ncbi:MAG: outer membrane beta-barrel protein [Saprospiraceae bacterium]